MSTQFAARLAHASRYSALPFLYPCCALPVVAARRAMMSAFRTQPGAPKLEPAPATPSTSTSTAMDPPALDADAAAPQIVARPPALPKVEKARPTIRSSKAALTIVGSLLDCIRVWLLICGMQTPRAVGRIQGLLKGPTPQLIRIGVRNKGCAGLSYHLEYVEAAGRFDEVVEQDGVRVLIDSKALFSMIGSEMDWTEDGLR